MKLFGGILTLVVGAIISAVAAYFSVIGLAAIFAASYWAVVVMGVSLEAGKIVAAGWLHANWRNPAVNWAHKTYMTGAIVALMMITSLGIYGFLSKGYLEQQAASGPVAMQIAQKESRVNQLTVEVQRLENRQTQLDNAVNAMIETNPNSGLRARRQQSSERAEIRREIEEATTEINSINEELVPLKLEVADVDAKLGPIKYAAEAFGKEDDPDVAVRFIILLLMSAFDPLAVVLVISGIITINEAMRLRNAQRAEVVEEVVEEAVEETPVEAEDAGKSEGEVIADEPVSDDREDLIDILERNPELLQDMIEAINETNNHAVEDNPKDDKSWAKNLRIKDR